MPNYIKNRLVIIGTNEQIKELFEKYNTHFPSNVIFPDFKKIIPPPDDDAYKDLPSQEIARISPNWWYAWNIKNWGTKWNVLKCETEQLGTYTFITAWSGVYKIMLKLSEQNPDIEFNYEYADENIGYNCASYKFQNGKILSAFEPETASKEAYDLSFKLWPRDKDYYILIDGNYQYRYDEEEDS